MGATYTLNVHQTLFVLDCCQCGMTFGMSTDFERRRREDHDWWYCPKGHQQHFAGPSDTEKAKRRATELERRLASREEDLLAERMRRNEERRRHAATKGQLTKARKRADAGVCQHCNRTFANVARHVEHMHPEAVTP